MNRVSRECKSVTVFDLEFTAWSGSLECDWSRRGERPEIVQIGALRLDALTAEIVDQFDVLIQPRLNPILSDYFVELTGVTNDDLAVRGVDFTIGYRSFLRFIGSGVIFSHGRDDLIVMENLRLYGWAGRMPIPHHVDTRPWFGENGINLIGRRACHVAAAAGGEFFGREHNALDDARSVATGIQILIARGARNLLLG
jgi:inhibitor of KinA sporulation pathway (predicted exonuclease)